MWTCRSCLVEDLQLKQPFYLKQIKPFTEMHTTGGGTESLGSIYKTTVSAVVTWSKVLKSS